MGITINQTYAKIGIDTTPAKLEMRNQNARLELHQKHAKVDISTDLPKVEIDSYQSRASAGLKNNGDLINEAAQNGYQSIIGYIGKLAEDGDALAAIESGGNPIVSMAERDAFPEHEFGIDCIPKVLPSISVKGEVRINPQPNGAGIHNGVEGNYIAGRLDVNFTPPSINIYLRQYSSLTISYTGTKVDSYR